MLSIGVRWGITGRCEDDDAFAGAELEVGSGGVDLAALGDGGDDGAGRPCDVRDAMAARGRVRGDAQFEQFVAG